MILSNATLCVLAQVSEVIQSTQAAMYSFGVKLQMRSKGFNGKCSALSWHMLSTLEVSGWFCSRHISHCVFDPICAVIVMCLCSVCFECNIIC